MQKRWPEMSGYSRAHDPGSNRTLPWPGRRPSGRQQACRRGKPDRERRCIKCSEYRPALARFGPRIPI